jgi:hypothetical protein
MGPRLVQIIVEAEIRISFEFEMGGQPAVVLLQFLANFVQKDRIDRRVRMGYGDHHQSQMKQTKRTICREWRLTPMNDQRYIVLVGRVERNPRAL